MRRVATSICLGIFLSLAAIPVASAAPPPGSDPVAESQALYARGLAQFEVAEYDQALVQWNQAYVLLSPTPEVYATRAALVLNIVLAHERAYAVSHNPDHLGEGMRLIDNRKAELTQVYGQDPTAQAEQARLDARRVEIADAYAAALARGETPVLLPAGTGLRYDTRPAEPPAPVPVVAPAVPPPAPKLDTLVAEDPTYGPDFRRGKTLAGGGAVMIGVGGVGLIIGIALAGTGALLDDSWGRPGEARGYYIGGAVTGGIGGATLIGGITMVVLGNRAKNKARQGYQGAHPPMTMAAPILLPGGGGLGVVGRF